MVQIAKGALAERDLRPKDPAAEAERERELLEETKAIRACQTGDVEAFGKIVRKYEKKVFWIAYNLTNDVEDARDIAQEAFLRVYRAIDRFNLKYNFYTWLYRIVVNLAIDQLRKRGKQVAVSIEEFPTDPPVTVGPDQRMKDAETKRLITKVLDGLPAKYKTVLVLRDIHELSCEEISKIINCTSATTRWRLHKARELFKARWERVAGV